MDAVVTPDPHLIPGYTGHCTQNRMRIGKTYGKQTHRLLIDPCLYHAPDVIVPPIKSESANKENQSLNEIQILRQREQFVDPIYRYPIIPGYAGFVPNMDRQMGKRFVVAASAGVAEHETLMELYRCNRRTLMHRDLLESGNGLFEHKLGERMLTMTNYRAPLIPVRGRSVGVKIDHCPHSVEKLPYSKFTIPHFLNDDDEDKYIINGYAAHIPMAVTRYGETNKVLTHRALCNFSEFMCKRARDRWCLGQDLTSAKEVCPPKGHFVIYHKNVGMMPNYAGHVPGANYKIGRTYGNCTYDAKHWLDIHKNLTVLPEIAIFD